MCSKLPLASKKICLYYMYYLFKYLFPPWIIITTSNNFKIVTNGNKHWGQINTFFKKIK